MAIAKDIAYIFPGQGAQYAGMGKDLYDNFKEARDVFDRANDALGYDIRELCFNGPPEKLSTTTYSQPAILVTSVAALRVAEPLLNGNTVKAVMGLSLGEYSALVSAGCLTFEDAVKLVSFRGRFMEEASLENPGKMASVIGLSTEAVEEIAKEAGCEIANLNCPGQIVISGKAESIDRAAVIAKERGAKRTIILDVSGPFHSSLMKSASDKLKDFLEGVRINDPSFPVVSNVDASYEEGEARIKDNLLAQLTGRTRWEDSVKLVAKQGVKTYLEIGPGRVLKGLMRRIDPDLDVINIGTADDIENLRRTL